MSFKCEKITIKNDPDFGCTIEFAGKSEKTMEKKSIKDFFEPDYQYLIIQRSYPEFPDETDWYSIETSESGVELNHLDNIIINIKKELIDLCWSGEMVSIELEAKNLKLDKLKKTLKSKFKDKVILLSE